MGSLLGEIFCFPLGLEVTISSDGLPVFFLERYQHTVFLLQMAENLENIYSVLPQQLPPWTGKKYMEGRAQLIVVVQLSCSTFRESAIAPKII